MTHQPKLTVSERFMAILSQIVPSMNPTNAVGSGDNFPGAARLSGDRAIEVTNFFSPTIDKASEC
jgi:hypothetical protein